MSTPPLAAEPVNDYRTRFHGSSAPFVRAYARALLALAGALAVWVGALRAMPGTLLEQAFRYRPQPFPSRSDYVAQVYPFDSLASPPALALDVASTVVAWPPVALFLVGGLVVAVAMERYETR